MSTFLDTERIRRLRTARGLTQTDLATELRVPTSTVARLESRRVEADGTMINLIAKRLGCAPDKLMSPVADVLHTRPLLRAYADAPKKAVDQYIADTLLAVETFETLRLRRMPDRLPTFVGDPNDPHGIDEFAEEVRDAADVSADTAVQNVTRAAERLGCIVLPMKHELGKHLGMSIRADDMPVIRASRPGDKVPGDRQRFTVAHELGHVLLHSPCPPPESSEQAKLIEKQAHRFAAGFLLPGDAFLEDLASTASDRVTLSTLVALKERWGVAIKAMVMRLQHLGRIDGDQARSLYKQISARGWNTGEPVFVGHERAVWLTKALARRFPGDARFTRAAKEAGIDAAWFERWTEWQEAPAPEQATILEFRASTASPIRPKHLNTGLQET